MEGHCLAHSFGGRRLESYAITRVAGVFLCPLSACLQPIMLEPEALIYGDVTTLGPSAASHQGQRQLVGALLEGTLSLSAVISK